MKRKLNKQSWDKSLEIRVEQQIERMVTKIIERHIRGLQFNFNTAIRGVSQETQYRSTRDTFKLFQAPPNVHGFNIGNTVGQVFAVLANEMQRAMFRNM